MAIALFASQANASSDQSVNTSYNSFDMKTCYNKLNELKKYDQSMFRTLNKSLMTVVQSRASLNASEIHASPEAMSYIRAQQTKTISNKCEQISQKLDEMLIKTALLSLNS